MKRGEKKRVIHLFQIGRVACKLLGKWPSDGATAQPTNRHRDGQCRGVGRTPVRFRPLSAPHDTRITNRHVPFDGLLMGLGVLRFSHPALFPPARGGHFPLQLLARRAVPRTMTHKYLGRDLKSTHTH